MDYRKFSVLYVDDETGNLIVFKKNFEQHFNVITTESPLEAMKLLERCGIAVLLADQKMPGMTGVELLAHAKAHYPDVIRMIITAYSELDIAVNAINLGHVHRYICKPWRPDELLTIIQSNIELYQKNMTLRELQAELLDTSRMAVLGTMAAGLTHQINSPLAFLRNSSRKFSELVERYERLVGGQKETDGKEKPRAGEPGTGADLAEFERYAAQQAGVVGNLERTVRSFVDAYRSRDQGMRRVVLRDFLDNLTGLLGPEVSMRGSVAIECDRAITIDIDTYKLGQVLLNIILNALQSFHAPEKDSNRVIIKAVLKEPDLVFSITDNGPGIPPGDIERIFDPFFTRKGKAGLGLGLTISRELVSLLKGKLEIESEEGVGTQCHLTVPVVHKAGNSRVLH
jgi:two-component system NtrC family sensor kinase